MYKLKLVTVATISNTANNKFRLCGAHLNLKFEGLLCQVHYSQIHILSCKPGMQTCSFAIFKLGLIIAATCSQILSQLAKQKQTQDFMTTLQISSQLVKLTQTTPRFHDNTAI